jgi:hypothetical protein
LEAFHDFVQPEYICGETLLNGGLYDQEERNCQQVVEDGQQRTERTFFSSRRLQLIV